ncbi:UBA/THIF-type NAD/FAD binding protein [Methylobacter tundripaludum SV96]|uniref:UBA/THIF-type NAD/FAD binding protein n=2 Tax=Methylobacter tundripaludum TaxID=173365 RepID=G3IS84_METTV|nr:UBA/THIF-type NAD/FAD binding protein [Methylobacter tundripaludum SV96]
MTTAHQFAHNFLREKGFKRIPSTFLHKYEGIMPVKNTEFSLEISFYELDFIDFPEYRLLNIPEGLNPHLPHVEPDGSLCYLDKEFIYLDRYNPEDNFVLCFQCVENLLASYAENDTRKFSQDYADEFTAYWQGKFFAYIKSWNYPLQALMFDRYSILDNAKEKTEHEIIIFNNQQEANTWLKLRNAANTAHSNKTIPVIVTKLTQPKLIRLFEKWPLSSRQEFFAWLTAIDPSAAQSFISSLLTVIKNNRSSYVVLQTPGGNVGALIEIDKQIVEALKRSQNQRQNKKGNKPASPSSILLRKSLVKEKFFLINVRDASDSRITTRNQDKEFSLVGKKIALIGCGTVGSFTALLLAQLGAGIQDNTHKGVLALFDPDILMPDNLGRHVLNMSYVGENKALAMADFLTNQAVSNTINFIGNNKRFDVKNLALFSKYELIIDATGNEAFSTSLSHYYHRSETLNVLIHGWVIAAGKAVRAILDDRTGACYRCLRISNQDGELQERFKLFSKDKEPPDPIKRNCGNAYFPYASGASASAAALIQQLAIDYFSGNPSPRFRHSSLSLDVQHTKNCNPQKLDICPCCSKIL